MQPGDPLDVFEEVDRDALASAGGIDELERRPMVVHHDADDRVRGDEGLLLRAEGDSGRNRLASLGGDRQGRRE